MVAKQVLTLDALAGGGRAVLGIALGARETTMRSAASTCPHAATGRFRPPEDPLDLERRQRDRIERRPPAPGDVPKSSSAARAEASFERAAKFGDGWTQGGAGPDQFKEDAARRWTKRGRTQGREGSPVQDGPDLLLTRTGRAEERRRGPRHYYAWLGEEIARAIVAGAAKDPDTVKQYLAAFESAGCDELIFFPAASDPAQVELLAEAAGL